MKTDRYRKYRRLKRRGPRIIAVSRHILERLAVPQVDVAEKTSKGWVECANTFPYSPSLILKLAWAMRTRKPIFMNRFRRDKHDNTFLENGEVATRLDYLRIVPWDDHKMLRNVH